MEALTIVYLAYMFIGLYLMSFFIIVYLRNRKNIFEYPKAKKHYKISIIIPAYNEEDTIEETIKAVFNSDYNLYEVIVVNDGSKDRTAEIVRNLTKKYTKLKKERRKSL